MSWHSPASFLWLALTSFTQTLLFFHWFSSECFHTCTYLPNQNSLSSFTHQNKDCHSHLGWSSLQCWADDKWLHDNKGRRQQKGWEGGNGKINGETILGLSNNHTSWTEPGGRWTYRVGGGSRWWESKYLFRTGYLIQRKLICSHMTKFEVTYRVKNVVSNLCQLYPGDCLKQFVNTTHKNGNSILFFWRNTLLGWKK